MPCSHRSTHCYSCLLTVPFGTWSSLAYWGIFLTWEPSYLGPLFLCRFTTLESPELSLWPSFPVSKSCANIQLYNFRDYNWQTDLYSSAWQLFQVQPFIKPFWVSLLGCLMRLPELPWALGFLTQGLPLSPCPHPHTGIWRREHETSSCPSMFLLLSFPNDLPLN